MSFTKILIKQAGDQDATLFIIKIVLVYCNCLLCMLTDHPEHPNDDPY